MELSIRNYCCCIIKFYSKNTSLRKVYSVEIESLIFRWDEGRGNGGMEEIA